MTIWLYKVVDWAFVELYDHIPLGSNTTPHIPQSHNPSKYNMHLSSQEGAQVTEFGEFAKGEWHCKWGKATRLTDGKCNGIKVSCRWNYKDRKRFDLQGNEVLADPERLSFDR